MSLIVAIAILISGSTANAIFDFMGQKADDMAQGAAVVSASVDMLEEVGANAQLIADLEQLQRQINEVNRLIDKTKGLSDDTKRALKGPQLDPTRRLSDNIRYTTTYIRRTKDILKAVGILSPAATTAINTSRTNMSLNEMLMNQQRQMIRDEQRDAEERKKKFDYELFVQQQREKRNKRK